MNKDLGTTTSSTLSNQPTGDQSVPTQRIVTHFVYPPIPVRNFDWAAVTDSYEPGCPIGYGATEQDAIADLQEQLES